MNKLLDDLELFHKNQIWLAISGGVDSMVLLDIYAKAYHDNKILKPKVLHINHHIHPDANIWASLVKKTAESYGLDVIIQDISVGETSIEETARHLRYHAMLQYMHKDDVLLTAHHLDDQKETFIFRAFRGTGLKGLVGIRKEHFLFGHRVYRPFYQIPKSEILKYATLHQLIWVEDPSNADIQYKRNEIREALSMIKATDSFALTQVHLERQGKVLDQLLKEKLTMLTIEPHILNLNLLIKEEQYTQLELFHYWLSQVIENVSYHRTLAIYRAMISAKKDRYPQEKIGEYTLLRYRNCITLLILPNLDITIESSEEWIDLKEVGKIHNPCRILSKITLLSNNKGQYKKPLQRLNIPMWLRGYIPVINQKIVFRDNNYQWIVPQKWSYWLK